MSFNATKAENTVDQAYGDASDAEWAEIRLRFGPNIVFYPDVFRCLVGELRAGRLPEGKVASSE